MTDVPTIVYELALRSLDQQERELSELRARTNTVIAAAALTASFLGAAAIRQDSGLSGWSIAALVTVAATGGLSLVVLWPRELSFVYDASATYTELYPSLDHIPEAQLRVAYSARDRYRSNKKTIVEFPRFRGHLMAVPTGRPERMSVDAIDPAVLVGVPPRGGPVAEVERPPGPTAREGARMLDAVA